MKKWKMKQRTKTNEKRMNTNEKQNKQCRMNMKKRQW
jgi:hypothetical protein